MKVLYDGDVTVRPGEKGRGANYFALSFQFGAGLSLALNSHVILDLGYRFVASNDPKFEAVEAEFTSQHVLFGGRVVF